MMMAETRIELQACDPAANRQRAWRLEAGRDLFGAWTTEVQFGRIGRRGRILRRAFVTDAELAAFVRARLRRRATAPARIGVAYRCVDADSGSAPLLAMLGITPRNDVNAS
jgi:hypothetical protein